MKVTGTDQVLFHHNRAHTRDLFLRLNKLRHDNLLCDLTILVQGQKFKAHKVVMAASSNYLLAAVRSEKATPPNQADPNHVTIELDHVTTRGFAPLLDYAYTSELNVGASDVIDVLAAASYMQMFDVARACSEFMRTSWPQPNHTPLVNLQLFANHAPLHGAGETSQVGSIENSCKSYTYPNQRGLSEHKFNSNCPTTLSFVSQNPTNTGGIHHFLSNPLPDAQAALSCSVSEKENKSAATCTHSNLASLFRSSPFSNDLKKENPSYLLSTTPQKEDECGNISTNGENKELLQDVIQERESNENDRRSEDQRQTSSPEGINNNSNSTPANVTSQKPFEESYLENQSVNNSLEKNEIEEKNTAVQEIPVGGAMESWQQLQRRLYNLRQSELQTMWNPTNLFATGQGVKTADILRNALTPMTSNRSDMSLRKDAVVANMTNLPNPDGRLSMLSTFGSLPFQRQFLQHHFLAQQQQQQQSQPTTNPQRNNNAMVSDLPAVPPSGQYTSVRRRTLQSNVPKPHQCQICGSKFTRYHNLKQHIKLHSGVKPYECDVCGKRFTRNYTLRLHKMKHIGLRNFRCGTCDAAFTSLGEFRAHLRLTMHSHFQDAGNKNEASFSSSSKNNQFLHSSTLLEAPQNKFGRFTLPTLNYGIISPGSSGGGAAGEGSTGTISPPSHEQGEAGSSPQSSIYNPNSPKGLTTKSEMASREENPPHSAGATPENRLFSQTSSLASHVNATEIAKQAGSNAMFTIENEVA